MSFVDEVRADRQPLAHVLKKHRGIRKIVEDLYPDRAHFIYELLQNAEDAEATEARFTLKVNAVSFEHNGRPFCKKDLWGITDIGEGSKVDEDKIGRFGVGFKAVFAYSETPRIWSPTYSFEISDLVLPTEITSKPQLGQKTQFEFPFNNPKKSAQDAYAEVEAGLNELAETTLLFLSHLESIRWQIGQQVSGKVLRIKHPENLVEVLKQTGGKTTVSSHFLCFSDSVEGLEKRSVSIAFELEPLLNTASFDPTKILEKQLKIASADPGRVAVFFPAEKESSGLRFHLHAPFVPELSRASIKETPANLPLFKQIAKLAAASLHTIRELNLLTGEFLSVLPNPQDPIPVRYQPIRIAIIEEMNNHALTPTHSKSHAPAKNLLQAKAPLKDWLSPEDLAFLVDYDDTPPEWAIAASQKNSNADRFLVGLAIKKWDIDEFIEFLKLKSSQERRYIPNPPHFVSGPDAQFIKWLTSKSIEWHQQMYALLCADIHARNEYQRVRPIAELKKLLIIRLSNGKYSIGSKCYFPSIGDEIDEILPRVDKGIYSSGKSKTAQEDARKFLEDIGVREVGEAEQVQAILDQRYKSDNFQPDMKDLERFVALVEKEGHRASIFANYYIFKLSDGKWGKPSDVYLDFPFLETGLSAYFNAIGPDAPKALLANDYCQSTVSSERILKFVKAVGVQTRLEIEADSCFNNPAVQSLVYQSSGGWSSSYGVNEDYTINGLDSLLKNKNEALSRLVWNTACDWKDTSWLRARYRSNKYSSSNEAPSQLVCMLKNAAWIPQTDGRFVRPSEASRSLLPKGFPYDDGDEWLKEICFGHEEQNKSQEHTQTEATLKKMGFPDAGSLDRAKRFVAILSPEDQEKILAEHEKKSRTEFPHKEPRNPNRRTEGVGKNAEDAPDRIAEIRLRSVSVGLEEVKQEAEEYLREQYSNPDEEMFCQICQFPLPFKLDDGRFYFEKVEFLPKLKQRYYQNYLALCPNHAAMFQHANHSREKMRELFSTMGGLLIDIVLAQSKFTIRFTKTHIADLKTVIDIDQELES